MRLVQLVSRTSRRKLPSHRVENRRLTSENRHTIQALQADLDSIQNPGLNGTDLRVDEAE